MSDQKEKTPSEIQAKLKRITYKRPSGSTIELCDTPNMAALAKSRGWEASK